MSVVNEKLGDLLRLERERRGFKLDKISAELKIPESNLRAIELGDPTTLPSELYFRLFAKSYAEYLGIDYARTLDAIRVELGEFDEPATPTPRDTKKGKAAKPEPRKEPPPDEHKEAAAAGPLRKLYIVGAVIIFAFIAFVVVYLIFLRKTNSAGHDQGDTSGETQSRAIAGKTGGENPAESYNWNVPELTEPDSLVLTLTARESSWATVLADGDTALYQNLNPGRVYRVAAKYRLVTSVGVPRFVTVTLNGKPAFLADPESGRISRVEVNQVNRERFAEPRVAARPTRTPTVSLSPDTGTAEDDSAAGSPENR
jgi:transcriptional regulator with XRE-family HTH domain